MESTHRFGLCMYGIQFLTGSAGRGTPLANPDPLDADAFLRLAIAHRLSSIEVPLHYVSSTLDRGALVEYATEARRNGLDIVVAGPNIMTADDVELQIELTAAIGSTRLRCISSGLLCGDRVPVGGIGGWRKHKERVIDRLRAIAPVASANGVSIGVENHQDCDSFDLVEICESVASDRIGVTLDTGNPVAVGEDPLDFARRILPFLANVHLKDYRMIDTAEGFRLVHCAIGSGIVDFDALWSVLDERAEVPRGIEMAALSERHIRIFTSEYWDGFEPRDARSLAPVMKLLRDRGETVDTDDAWKTPIEAGDTSDAARWEMERLEQSVRNLAQVAARARR